MWVITDVFTACGHTQWEINNVFDQAERDISQLCLLCSHRLNALGHTLTLLYNGNSCQKVLTVTSWTVSFLHVLAGAVSPVEVGAQRAFPSDSVALLCNRMLKNKIDTDSDVGEADLTVHLHPSLLSPSCLTAGFFSTLLLTVLTHIL